MAIWRPRKRSIAGTGCADTSLRVLALVTGCASCFASASSRRVRRRIDAWPRNVRPQRRRVLRARRRKSSRKHQLLERHSVLFSEIGYGGRRPRQRPEVPREITDEVTLELLALLGPRPW